MITSELRTLNREGLEVFRAWLDRAEANVPKRWTDESPPTSILTDDQYSRSVGFEGRLVQRRFEHKYDLGMDVYRALGPVNVNKLVAMNGVWAWLSLFFYESTFPQKNGRWFTGERSRHLVQTIQGRKQDQSHRHLVKSAVTNVLRFDRYAAVLMGDASGQSKMEEQVMSRRVDPPLAHHKEFVKALYTLYWDADNDDLKSGARSDGPGSVMHMIDLLTQFDMTYDISSLEADDFLQLLPHDFDKFRKSMEEQEAVKAGERPSKRSRFQRIRALLTP